MLHYLRKGRHLQIIIVGFLAAVVCVWGISGVLTSRQQSLYAGRIFGRKVSYIDYARAWELTRQNLREIYRVDLPKELVEEHAWLRLLLLAEAKRRGIRVSDQEVVERIRSISLFQQSGVFERTLYDTFLKLRRTVPRAFEEAVREDIAIAHLRSTVLGEVRMSDEDVHEAYTRTYAQARVAYLLVETEGFLAPARREATPEALQAYFTAHAAEFSRPEAVNLDYLAFRPADLPLPAVTEEEIQAYYLTHQQQLAPTDPGAAPAATLTPAVHQRVTQILQAQKREDAFDALAAKVADRVEKGKTLETLARDFNRPVQSTGFFSQDEPVPTIGKSPDIAAQAFRLPVGDRTVWLDTEDGGCVIRVKEKRPAHPSPFADVQELVRDRWARARARELAQAQAAEIAAACKTRRAGGECFETVAKETGYAVRQPDPFTRTGYIAGLGVAPAFARAAFALAPGGTSDAVEVPGGFAVVQLMEILPADEERLAKERATFTETLRRQKEDAHFQAWLQGLKTRARLVRYTDDRRP